MANNIPSDNIVVRHARMAVKAELNKKRALNQPIAKFDSKTKTIYMENGDGTRQVIGGTSRGRYGD